MPAIIAKSISILSDAGLGMAMFSLGKFFFFFFSFIPYKQTNITARNPFKEILTSLFRYLLSLLNVVVKQAKTE